MQTAKVLHQYLLRQARVLSWNFKTFPPVWRCSISQHGLLTHPSTGMCTTATGIKLQIDEYVQNLQKSDHTVDKQTVQLCHLYTSLPRDKQKIFLSALAAHYHVNHSEVFEVTQTMCDAKEREEGVLVRIEERLRKALVPTYQHIFQHISHMQHGVKFLVDMRSHMLRLLSEPSTEDNQGHIKAMDQCLRHMLSMWFAVGFLTVQRVTWSSSCELMQKVSEYEAVHPIRNWLDVKNRVGPYRRCFIFTHNTMPDEPIVVLHVALTSEISSSIQSIVRAPRTSESQMSLDTESVLDVSEDTSDINTAIFYSITSTQKGLQGIEMGNYLIKKVVQELIHELPSMSQFSSLSPIPGYRDWLLLQIHKHHQELDSGSGPSQSLFTKSEWKMLGDLLNEGSHHAILAELKKLLSSYAWAVDASMKEELKEPLTRLCARYLYLEKRRGRALNPVGNFHLRNGAILWRINWLADVSPRGLTASCGLMVNYKYELDSTEYNSQNYLTHQDIAVSKQVLDLVNTDLNE